MKYLINYFLQNKLLVNLLVVLVLIGGLFTITSIQKEGIPNITINQLFISTVYPGAAPADVELNVSMVIEDALEEIDGIDGISSISQEGLSQVVIEIDEDLSDDEADDVKRDIEKAIDRIPDLPADILENPYITEVKTSIFPILELNIQGDNEESVRKMANKLDLKLRRSPGVSKISKVGYREKEIRIELDQNKLRDTETSIMEIFNAINANNVRLSGGTLETHPVEKSIVTVEELKTPEQVKNVIIRSNFSGKTLKIKDLANVEKDYEEQDLYVRSNGKTAVSLCIHKKEKSDILKTIKGVKKILDKTTWEDGTSYVLSNDMSSYTKNRLKMVVTNGTMGMIMVFITLLIFLDLRTAIWTSFGIPFTFLLAFIFFPKAGLTINALSLGGLILVLGMLVDDAIIVAENIHKAKEEGKTSKKDILEAVYDIVFPVSFSIITTILAFLPLIFIPGVMGKFIYSIPMVVMLALAASWFESIFILPSHLSSHENSKTKVKKKKKFMQTLESKYEKTLIKVLSHKLIFLTLIFLSFIGSLWYAKNFIPFYFAPKDGATEFSIRLHAPVGTPIEKTLALTKPIETIVNNLPDKELESFSTRVGYDSTFYWSDLGTDSNYAVIYVYLTPYTERTRTAEQIIEKIKKDIEPYKKGFDEILPELNQRGPKSGKPISVQLLSDNGEQRKAAAKELISFIKKIEGVSEIEDDTEEGKAELRLDIDHDKINKLGLDIYGVASTLRIAFSGTKITSIRDGNEDIDLIIKLAPEFRKDTKSLMNLAISNRSGKMIRIKNFASLVPQTSQSSIVRYDRMRSITIQGEVVEGKTTPLTVMTKTNKFIKSKLIDKYPDVVFEFKGEGKATADSFGDIGKLFLVAVIAIYFILVLAFGSFIEPVLIMSAIPLSVMPVIAAFALHGRPLTFQALIGFVGLAGVVVNDSLVMVTRIKKMGIRSETSCKDCIVEGAVSRLRPILLTTITTVIGVMPMIYGWGGYDEYLMPMGMALGYGLLGASLLTLFVVPCLVSIIESIKDKFNKTK